MNKTLPLLDGPMQCIVLMPSLTPPIPRLHCVEMVDYREMEDLVYILVNLPLSVGDGWPSLFYNSSIFSPPDDVW